MTEIRFIFKLFLSAASLSLLKLTIMIRFILILPQIKQPWLAWKHIFFLITLKSAPKIYLLTDGLLEYIEMASMRLFKCKLRPFFDIDLFAWMFVYFFELWLTLHLLSLFIVSSFDRLRLKIKLLKVIVLCYESSWVFTQYLHQSFFIDSK